MTDNNSDLRARVLAEAARTPSLSRPELGRIAVATALAAIVTSSVVGLAVARALSANLLPMAPRPLALLVLTSLGAALIALGVAWVALRRGTVLGASRRTLLAVSVASPLALFFWKVLCSAQFANAQDAVADRPGLRCLALSLVVGAAPLAAALALRRRSDPRHPAVSGLAIGVAAGAATWIAIDLWCPVGNPRHLLLGHLFPLAMLAACGAAAGKRWLAIVR